MGKRAVRSAALGPRVCVLVRAVHTAVAANALQRNAPPAAKAGTGDRCEKIPTARLVSAAAAASSSAAPFRVLGQAAGFGAGSRTSRVAVDAAIDSHVAVASSSSGWRTVRALVGGKVAAFLGAAVSIVVAFDSDDTVASPGQAEEHGGAAGGERYVLADGGSRATELEEDVSPREPGAAPVVGDRRCRAMQHGADGRPRESAAAGRREKRVF